MAVPTLSNEATIRQRLSEVGCAENAFVQFNGVVGRTRFFEAMRGGKHFSQSEATRLLEIIDEMVALKQMSPVAPDWSNTVGIQNQLAARRALRQAVKYDVSDAGKTLLGLHDGAVK